MGILRPTLFARPWQVDNLARGLHRFLFLLLLLLFRLFLLALEVSNDLACGVRIDRADRDRFGVRSSRPTTRIQLGLPRRPEIEPKQDHSENLGVDKNGQREPSSDGLAAGTFCRAGLGHRAVQCTILSVTKSLHPDRIGCTDGPNPC